VITGRVQAEGLAFGGDARRASIVIRGGDDDVPLTAVVPAADGEFRAVVPATTELSFELWSFGRRELRGPIPDDGALGTLAAPAPATVELHVARDGQPIDALVVFEPADAATRAGTRGSFHGRLTPCAPWLGPPDGASPACNRVLVEPAGTQVEVPAGHYWVFASAGPDATIARGEVRLDPGELTAVDLDLRALAVTPPGWLAADLHVHGAASFDSGLPDRDRVRSFLAAGVDVIAATDHDYVTDYAATVRRAGRRRSPAGDGRARDHAADPVPRRRRRGPPAGDRALQLLAAHPGAGVAARRRAVGRAARAGRAVRSPRSADRRRRRPHDQPPVGRAAVRPRPRLPARDRLRSAAAGAGRPTTARPTGRWRGARAVATPTSTGTRSRSATAPAPTSGRRTACCGSRWRRPATRWSAPPTATRTGCATTSSAGAAPGSRPARRWPTTDAAGFDRALKAGHVVAGSGVFIAVTIGPPGAPRRGLGLTPVVPQPGDVDRRSRCGPRRGSRCRDRARRDQRAARVTLVDRLVDPADPFGVDGVVRWRGEVRAGRRWWARRRRLAGRSRPGWRRRPTPTSTTTACPTPATTTATATIDADDIEDGRGRRADRQPARSHRPRRPALA
jgi:hypothetical protein